MENSNSFSILLLITSALLITACGGGGGGESNTGATATGGSNRAPVAATSSEIDLARDSAAFLDGSASSDADNDALNFTWTQTGGADVTGGAGILTGATPSFTSPEDVGTLFFDLVVNDGLADSDVVSIRINVLEHLGPSFYVDADNGDDTLGDGSRANPFASISHAIDSIPGPNYDIYVATPLSGAYDETASRLDIPFGTSLYGGYDANWIRDLSPANLTPLNGDTRAIHFVDVDDAAWFSGFLLVTELAGAGSRETTGISVDSGNATLYIQDNVISVGRVWTTQAAPTDSYGLRLAGIDRVRVLRNSITAGDGGFGSDGADGANGADGDNGSHSTSQNGGADGLSGCAYPTKPACHARITVTNHGGIGGRGGNNPGGNGSDGGNGRNAGDGINGSGASGGAGGYGGSSTNQGGHGEGGLGGNNSRIISAGNGGRGGDGNGFTTAGFYNNTPAQGGRTGGHASGGGGGGGGEAGTLDDGGGGGGGGAGGTGGIGGDAGFRGGASIGVLLDAVTDALIDANTITSGNGGDGGDGGTGGLGGDGGNGGNPRGQQGGGERGGHGGGGGHGGEGGQGGSGGVISNNTLISGNGGQPGADGAHSNGGAQGGRWGQNGSHGSNGGAGQTGYSGIRASSGSAAEGGWSYNIYDASTSDGMSPVANANSFTTGTAGNRGSSGTTRF